MASFGGHLSQIVSPVHFAFCRFSPAEMQWQHVCRVYMQPGHDMTSALVAERSIVMGMRERAAGEAASCSRTSNAVGLCMAAAWEHRGAHFTSWLSLCTWFVAAYHAIIRDTACLYVLHRKPIVLIPQYIGPMRNSTVWATVMLAVRLVLRLFCVC